jgi:protein phosphatase 2C-like protein
MSTGRLPFQMRVSHFEAPRRACNLPFAVGGATQNHWDAAESQNSQDALAIVIESNVIVGVVTDGCTGTHPDIENSSNSSNEVGAKLIAYLVSRAAMTMALAKPSLSAETFVDRLSKTLHRKLSGTLRLLVGSNVLASELFTFDFLMATILGFVVTEKQFIIFHCGDGVIALNGEVHDLESEAGTYFASALVGSLSEDNRLDSRKRHSLKLFARGDTTELHSILLATDGLSKLISDHPDAIRQFITATPPVQQIKNGFDFLLREYRQKLAWNPDVTLNVTDDITFALLRRHDIGMTDHDHAL